MQVQLREHGKAPPATLEGEAPAPLHQKACGAAERLKQIRPGAEGVRARAVDVRFHDLRHTHASLLLASGVPVHVVRGQAGP